MYKTKMETKTKMTEKEDGMKVGLRMYLLMKAQEGDESSYASLIKMYDTFFNKMVSKYRGLGWKEDKFPDMLAEVKKSFCECVLLFKPEQCDYNIEGFNSYIYIAIERAIWGYINTITNYDPHTKQGIKVINYDFHDVSNDEDDYGDGNIDTSDGSNNDIQTFTIEGETIETAGIEFINLVDTGTDKEDILETPAEKRLRLDLEHLLSSLEVREREVIIRLYGINGRKKESLQSIGNALELSIEMVSNISKKALMHMREEALRKNIHYTF